MFTKDALAFFGGSRSALAAALKIRPESTYDWGERVPDLRQLQLEIYSAGRLQAEDRLKPASLERAGAPTSIDEFLVGLTVVLREDEKTRLALAFERGPQRLYEEIESLELTLDVRAQLLAAARACEERVVG
jgi:hypothetical protein